MEEEIDFFCHFFFEIKKQFILKIKKIKITVFDYFFRCFCLLRYSLYR